MKDPCAVEGVHEGPSESEKTRFTNLQGFTVVAWPSVSLGSLQGNPYALKGPLAL